MYCRKCGRENPNDAKFCDACGTELHPSQPVSVVQQGQQEQSYYQTYAQPGTGGAVAVQKPKNRMTLIIVIILAVIGLIAFFTFKGSAQTDPLYGTWYVQLSELVGQPVTVTFTKDTVTFGAGSLQNSSDMTLKYEKIGNNTLKIYSEEGNDSAECTYQVKDDLLYLSSPTEKSLNIVLTRGDIKVPVN